MDNRDKKIEKEFSYYRDSINISTARSLQLLSELFNKSISNITDYISNDTIDPDTRVKVATDMLSRFVPYRAEIQGSGIPEIDVTKAINSFIGEIKGKV